MIETTQTVIVDRPLGTVWAMARDIQRWAELMPGLQDCELIDENNSRWVLKVGAGGMVRTVSVKVHVEQWDGPERVVFAYRLEKDPVEGGGTYTARALDESRTEVAFHVRVIGSGPMAPMWEAMGKPLLPKLAAGFAAKFKDRIEAGPESEKAAAGAARPSILSRLIAWFRSFATASRP